MRAYLKPLVTPLGEFVSIPNDLQLGIPENVGSVLFKKISHYPKPFDGLRWPSLIKNVGPVLECQNTQNPWAGFDMVLNRVLTRIWLEELAEEGASLSFVLHR